MDKTERNIISCVVVCILLLCLIGLGAVIDSATSRPVGAGIAVVESLGYTPATNQTGTGFGSKGEVIMTNSSTPAEFTVIVRTAEGVAVPVHLHREVWAHLKAGDRVRLVRCEGQLFGGTTYKIEKE